MHGATLKPFDQLLQNNLNAWVLIPPSEVLIRLNRLGNTVHTQNKAVMFTALNKIRENQYLYCS